MWKLTNVIFRLFGNGWKNRDSYKDASGRGFVQRFVEALADEYDENFALIRDIVDNMLVPKTLLLKFLPYAEAQIGVPYIIESESFRRKFLRFFFRVLRIKGTKLSYELMFRLLGFNVDFYITAPGGLTAFNLYIVESVSNTGTVTINDGIDVIVLEWGDRYYVRNNITTVVSFGGDARLKRETVIDIFNNDVGFDSTTEFSNPTFDSPTRRFDQRCQTCAPYVVRLFSGSALTPELHAAIFRAIDFVEPLGAQRIVYFNDVVLLAKYSISVWIDSNGDLNYDNTSVPEVTLSLDSNGDLIITGALPGQYEIDVDGNLIFLI